MSNSRQDLDDLLCYRVQSTFIFRGIKKTDEVRKALSRSNMVENAELGDEKPA